MKAKWIAALAAAALIAVATALGTAYAGGSNAHVQRSGWQPPSTQKATSKSHLKGTTWAVVASDGTLIRHGKHVVSASLVDDPGGFQVIFSGDVTGCAYVATIGSPDNSGPLFGEATVYARYANPDGIYVQTTNSSGTTVDNPFHVIISC